MTVDIYSLLAEQYGGGNFEVIEGSTATASAAVQQLFPQDPRRVAFVVVNMGALSIGISPLGDLSTTKRINVAANGGVASFNWRDDLVLPAREWFVMGSAALEPLLAIGVRFAQSENVTA